MKECIRCIYRKDNAGCTLDSCRVYKIKNAILENYHNVNFNVNLLADELNMPREKLYDLSCNYFDDPPARVISKLRIKYSLTLFLKQNLPLGSIAKRSGISSIKTFRNHFIKYFEISPRILRESLKDVQHKESMLNTLKYVLERR